MLRQRVITALLILLIFLCTLFAAPGFVFVILITILLLISAWEWANIAYWHRPMQRFIYVLATGLLLSVVVVIADISPKLTMNTEIIRYLLIISVSWWGLSLLWLQSYPASAVLWSRRWVLALVGWLILIPAWAALLYLHGLKHGNWLIVLVVAIVITADVGAYFSGKVLGKNKLAPIISPGKSWEGFCGGLIATAFLALSVAWMLDFSQWIQLVTVIVLVALASIVGDLVESMAKRNRGIKDSGSMLPGHGGFLDRLDSLTAAVPVFALAIISSDWGM